MVIDIREDLLDILDVEVNEILYQNDPEDWEGLLNKSRINDRITRIRDNIGFPKVKYNDKDFRHNKLRHRDGS